MKEIERDSGIVEYIGFEINKDYFQIACTRVKEAKKELKGRYGKFWKV